MTDDEMKKAFARNINTLISLSGKKQKEIAADLDINPTTFNTWCVGKILPSVGKVQKIADYFNVGKSVLYGDDTIEYPDSVHPLLITDADDVKLLDAYHSAPDSIQSAVRKLLDL